MWQKLVVSPSWQLVLGNMSPRYPELNALLSMEIEQRVATSMGGGGVGGGEGGGGVGGGGGGDGGS